MGYRTTPYRTSRLSTGDSPPLDAGKLVRRNPCVAHSTRPSDSNPWSGKAPPGALLRRTRMHMCVPSWRPVVGVCTNLWSLAVAATARMGQDSVCVCLSVLADEECNKRASELLSDRKVYDLPGRPNQEGQEAFKVRKVREEVRARTRRLRAFLAASSLCVPAGV